jgi:molybdopterin molybdotransferase
MSASGLLEIDDARERVLAAAATLPAEQVAVGVQALGRVLAEDVHAVAPIPAFENSAMDGFAVRAGDLRAAGPASPAVLEVIGESRAGAPAAAGLESGQAIAISTGAMLPAGADAVVRVEDTHRVDGHVEITSASSSGEHVRRVGEDVQAGMRVLGRGTTIGPSELGVLASLGRTHADCTRRPLVSVLVTGDELLSSAQRMRKGGVRDSSSLTIPALAHCAGATIAHTGWAPDDAEATREGIAAALDGVDVAVVCGGVSVGEHDHVKAGLERLGARQIFWGLALKPGRPAWFGTAGDTLVFGLPGNPVSSMVTFTLLVAPALRALLGAADAGRATVALIGRDYEKPAGRAHALRCRLSMHEDGLHADPTGPQGSHILTSMLGADALAIIPSDSTHVRAGDRIRIEPLGSWTALPV